MGVEPGELPEMGREVFLIGDLRVDIGQQRVIRARLEVPLPNLSFQTLVALIRCAPNVLSNESLMSQVWPGLIVSPETVNKRVNLLRDALGDDVREPRYIAGVRSRGYRLVAPVSRAAGALTAPDLPMPVGEAAIHLTESPVSSVAGDAPVSEAPKLRRRYGRRVAFSIAGAGLLIAGAIVVQWASPDRAGGAGPDVPVVHAIAVGVPSRTVAVLPFDNISADSADAYLAQGLPEMILNRLSRIDGLSVIARNSSFALATKNIDSSEIGRRLNSGYLIGGSVQREADRLRVAVHLVDTAAGTHGLVGPF